MRLWQSSAGVLLVPALLASAVALAQDGGQRPTYRASANLIQIEAVVLDRRGQPVHGLRAEDFAVFDEGDPRPLAAFDEVRRVAAPAGPGRPGTGRVDVADNRSESRATPAVIVLDDLHVFLGRSERVRDIAASLIEQLAPEAPVAIAFTSGDQDGVELTTDRAELRRAIGRFTGRQRLRAPLDPLPRSHPGADLQEFDTNMRAIEGLRRISAAMQTGDGRRKAVIFISEWFGGDLTGLFTAMAPPGDVPLGGVEYALGGQSEALTRTAPVRDYEYALIDAVEEMRSSNVAFYAIDPRGHVSAEQLAEECAMARSVGKCLGTSGPGPPDWASQLRQAQHGLEHLAEATGGTAVVNTDEFAAGVSKLVADLDDYYLLGFVPAQAASSTWRRIELKVNRPGVVVHYRRGYRPAQTLNTTAADALPSLVTGALPSAGLPLRLYAVALPTERAAAKAVVILEIRPGREQMKIDHGAVRDTVRFSVVAVSPSRGRVAAQVTHVVDVGLVAADARSENQAQVAYAMGTAIDLPPGTYQLRAAAVSETLHLSGSVYQALEVPDFVAPQLNVGDLVLGRTAGPGAPVAFTERAEGWLPLTPTLDRTFEPDESLTIAAPIGPNTRPRRQTIELLDSRQKIIRSARTTLSELVGPDRQVVPFASGVLPLSGLPPGSYTIRLSVGDGRVRLERDVAITIER